MLRRPLSSTLFPYTTLFRSLLGEGLGRSHQRGLAAVLDRAQHGMERHHGLARAHLAHEKPLHRPSGGEVLVDGGERRDRKSTRLNSSHTVISYAVFCLKKKN